MSPREALRNPVALFYLGAAFGLLVLAGVIFGVLRWVWPRDVGHAWESYRGWLWIIPTTAAALLLGRESAIIFFTIVAVFGFREFARATPVNDNAYLALGVYAGIVANGVATLLERFDCFLALPVFATAGLVIVPVLRNRVEGQLQAVAVAVLGFVYIGWMFGHVAWLANSSHPYAYLVYLLFAVEVNDIAAYLSGRRFGRHKLRDHVSPNKTWEGTLGAVIVSLALPWTMWWTFPHLPPVDLVAIGLLVGVGGQLGDLALSAIKRDLKLKDMGTLIPGHGGILDRIDSLIYVAPLYVHYLRFCGEF